MAASSGKSKRAHRLFAKQGVLVDGVKNSAPVGKAEVAALFRDLAHRRGSEDHVLIDSGVAAEVGCRERDADVMKERTEIDASAAGGIELKRIRERRGDVTDPLGVADEFALRKVEALAKGDAQIGGGEGVQPLGSPGERPGEII